MQSRDHRAAELLKRLRVDQGLSPEELAWAVYMRSGRTVSGQTIRRIERTGAVPIVRVQFALAQFFDRLPSEVWAAQQARGVVVR
jgi:transcriptional regulator with XRE-family HTH domain